MLRDDFSSKKGIKYNSQHNRALFELWNLNLIQVTKRKNQFNRIGINKKKVICVPRYIFL